MHLKIISILVAIIFFSVSVQAQTIREKIDQQAKDPKTKENAAKADVYIVNKKAITDSVNERRKAKKNVSTKKPGSLKGLKSDPVYLDHNAF
jgi:hypothetical protein